LEILFASNKLERQLTDPVEMVKSFNKDRAKRISQRLDEIRAAQNLNVLRTIPMANCHELTQDRKGQLAVDVAKNFRLIFEPYHNPRPSKPDGGLDWTQVTVINILAIGDYH